MALVKDKEKAAAPKAMPAAGAERDDVIGRSLRRSYNDVVGEALPDALVELLSKLRQEDKG